MLDLAYIKEHADLIAENAKNRRKNVAIPKLLQTYDVYLALLREKEALQAERNTLAQTIGREKDARGRDVLLQQGKKLRGEIDAREEELTRIKNEKIDPLRAVIPNLTHPDAPIGESEQDNRVLRAHGDVPEFSFVPKDHVELMEALDLIDFERGTKVAGAKAYFLKNEAVLLEFALERFALDMLREAGFTLLTTPDFAKDEIVAGAGFSPRGPETQVYSLEGDAKSLIGTAEIAMCGYHQNEIFAEHELPRKYAAFSHCFRTEAGAYGRESKGLYRVHQFSKVEMFAYTTPETSEAMHQELIGMEEKIFSALGLPYRVVDLCTADLSTVAYRTFDVEAWMPGRGIWGEISSTSNTTTFQASRLGIKVERADGKKEYAHMLNGTAMTNSRIIIALVENYQQEDGSIAIPKPLHPYMGMQKIEKK